MRLNQSTDGCSHSALEVSPNDHHPQPTMVEIENTTQSLPPGTDYNLDITLPHSGFKLARIQILGPRPHTNVTGNVRPGAEVIATTDIDEAMSISCVEIQMAKTYTATYSKQNGDAYLSDKVFDTNTSLSAQYIALKDAYITGSILRLVFHNYFGGSAYLWVKGQALLW